MLHHMQQQTAYCTGRKPCPQRPIRVMGSEEQKTLPLISITFLTRTSFLKLKNNQILQSLQRQFDEHNKVKVKHSIPLLLKQFLAGNIYYLSPNLPLIWADYRISLNRILIFFYRSIITQGIFDPMINKINNLECGSASTLTYKYKRIKDYVYDLQAVLGQGNFSTVYQATQESTNELYAVKVVKLASLTFKKLEELLEQEIMIIRSLDHPNVIRCVEVLKSTNHCYFITQLCDGGNLQKTIKERGAMCQEEIWQTVSQMYNGLKYLSSKGIIHRDIKPANIFIKDGVIKIADFGFAIQSNQSFNDFNIGSPLYMSPEGFIHNMYGPKTDVWAFGIVLYELLHGRQPLLQCSSDEDLKLNLCKNIRDDQFRRDISVEVKDIIKRCLEVDESKRITFQQMQKTAYFQRYTNIRSMVEIKIVNSQRRPSMPLLKMFTPETSLKDINQTSFRVESKKAQKQNIRAKQTLKGPFRTKKRNTKRLTIEIRQVEDNKSILLDCRSKDLLLGSLKFNQSIGLIHFCRIGFKLAQQNLGDDLSRQIKTLILRVLTELQMRVNLGMIKYDVEQNRGKKESKLKLVISQYLSKYQKTLKGQSKTINIYQTINRLQKYLDQIQQNCKQEAIFRCYLTRIFTFFTQELINSINNKTYNMFGATGVIDGCLEEKVSPKTIEDYTLAKCKYTIPQR